MKFQADVANWLGNITVYSQASHLMQLQSLYARLDQSQRSMIVDRGYIHNSYLMGGD